ncbi:hypothetical protein BH09ACT11_BH09ACT11_07670 [soil metagenome]
MGNHRAESRDPRSEHPSDPEIVGYVGRRMRAPESDQQVEAPLFEVGAAATRARVVPDLSADLTVTMPLAEPGKRAARRAHKSHPVLRGLPSLAGAAALVIAGFAAVSSAENYQVTASKGALRPATAFGGTTAHTVVGERTSSVSRSSSRLAASAELAAKARNKQLQSLNEQAAAQAKSLEAGQWVLPLPQDVYRISGTFGATGLWSSHTGLDMACSTGTPIYAVADGEITAVGYSGNAGNRTWQVLADGTEIMYAHQSSFATSVGTYVRRGELIGYVGSTGRTTGPHLHIEVHPGGGDPVDPYAAMEAHGIDL